MPRKESSKRGYMASGEIDNHLREFKSERGKIEYLNRVLKKEKLLASKTKMEVYDKLLNIYMKKGGWDWWNNAENLAEKLGKEGQEKLLNKYMKTGYWENSEVLAKKIENKKVLPKIIEGYMKVGRLDDARDLAMEIEHKEALLKLIKKYWKRGDFIITNERNAQRLANYVGKEGQEKLLEAYMETENWDLAEELVEKLGIKDEKLAEIYEKRRLSDKVKKSGSGLEKKTMVFLFITIAGIAIGLGSLTITGNAVSNLTQTTPGLLGILLFISGIVGVFLCSKKK